MVGDRRGPTSAGPIAGYQGVGRSRSATGAFSLTGSVRLLGLRSVPDLLPGRMETIELWPLSQGEIDGKPDRFVDTAFDLGPDPRHVSEETRSSYIARSGQLLVPNALANSLRLSQATVQRYAAMLEEVFLIKRIPAWSRNVNTRAIGTTKVAMVNSGLAVALTAQSEASLHEPISPLGGLLEGLVAMEIARQLTWSEQQVGLFHYRTRDQVEVDIVLENERGQVVAIDVEASSTVRDEDFRGIRHLASRLGVDFCGD